MEKKDVIEIICRVLLVLLEGVSTVLFFLSEDIVLGILGVGLSIFWVWLLVNAIKKITGK